VSQAPKWERYIFAGCSAADHAMLRRVATREGLTMSDFVRRCVNQWLMDEGDDVPLLRECAYPPTTPEEP